MATQECRHWPMEHWFNKEHKTVTMLVCRDMTDIAKKQQVLLDKVTGGTNEPASTENFTSFLSVDRRLFGRIQEELTQAQSKLELKEQHMLKLTGTSITTTTRRNVTYHFNQERKEYIVMEHRAELINKDQPSMEDMETERGVEMVHQCRDVTIRECKYVTNKEEERDMKNI